MNTTKAKVSKKQAKVRHTKKTSGRPLLTIMVPVHNEEKTILKILNEVTRLPIEQYEVIVVNDSSTDKSSSIINKFQRNFKSKNVKLKVENHKVNQGKGAAIKTALLHAKGTYFVIQDADLEYEPADITPLIRTALNNNYRVVYGSRFKGKVSNMPKANYYANKFYNVLLRSLYNTKVTDMHTCYKMVKTDLLKDFNMQSDGFDYATELVSKILKRGIKIHEEPISFNGRTKKEGKHIDFKDGIDCTIKIIKYKVSKTV